MDIEIWQLYILFAIVLMISEVFLPSLILLPIGIGVMISVLPAVFIDNHTLLLVVTGIIVGAVFLTFKKIFNRASDKPSPTTVDAMLGAKVTAIEPITHEAAGYAKLYGDTWKALANEPGQTFQAGETATIVRIDGNKIFITRS